VTSFLKRLADSTGLFADDADGWLGTLTSGLSGRRSGAGGRDHADCLLRSDIAAAGNVVRHALAAAAVLGFSPSVAYDIRHAALAYLGITRQNRGRLKSGCRKPLSDVANTQVELLTDRNQTLAQIQGALASDDDGRSVLRGSVVLDYRTTDRSWC